MTIKQKISSLITASLILICTTTNAQIDQSALIQKAKAMGMSQSDIEAAMSSQQGSGIQNQNQNKSNNRQSSIGSTTLDTTSLRNEFTIKDLEAINPQRLEKIISNKIDQDGVVRDARGNVIPTTNQSGKEQQIMMDDKAEYEIVLKNGQFIKRPLQVIFGREIFSNRNLTFAPNYNLATPQNYILGAGDEVIVEVWGVAELFSRQKISPDGSVSIQGVGPISLNGLTIADADKRIKAKIGQVMGDAQAKLSLGQIRSIKVNIAGEVVAPGTYTLPSIATLFNALYSAGGVNNIGSLRVIKVFRDSKEIATLDVYEYLVNGKYDTNIRLEDNDMIIVSPYDSYVSIYGKIKRPRTYEMKKGETLSQLLSYSGGFTGDAYTENLNVKRKTGRQYSILTVEAPDFKEFQLSDGDSIAVDTIISEYSNRLQIKGAVWRPGEYELSAQTSTLNDLIKKAEGLKGNEFASRGQITRRKSDYTYELIPFDVKAIVSGAKNIDMQEDDHVYIPNVLELREDYKIVAKGEINKPDTLNFREGMTVEDVIVLCGGLKESASLAKIEIARRIKDPSSITYTSKTADVFTFNIDKNLSVGPEANRFLLMPFDEVYIRRSPGYNEQHSVKITGEVLFIGEYALASAGERISDIVKKSGGVTPEAYVRGASVKRRMTDDQKAKLESMIKMATSSKGRDSLSTEKIDITEDYPIGIDIAKAIANPGCSDDIILQNGDQIFIPKMNSTVKISGSVLYPNSVTFNKRRLKSYLSQAGGYQDGARKRPFVIYMNGKVAATKSGFLCKRYPKIEPGCEVVVPMKQTKQGNALGNIMGIMSSTTSMAAMLATILNISK